MSIAARAHPPLVLLSTGSTDLGAQVLNAYLAEVDEIGRSSAACKVLFYVQQGSSCTTVEATLPSQGHLGPLFQSFGLISQAELDSGAGVIGTGRHTTHAHRQGPCSWA